MSVGSTSCNRHADSLSCNSLLYTDSKILKLTHCTHNARTNAGCGWHPSLLAVHPAQETCHSRQLRDTRGPARTLIRAHAHGRPVRGDKSFPFVTQSALERVRKDESGGKKVKRLFVAFFFLSTLPILCLRSSVLHMHVSISVDVPIFSGSDVLRVSSGPLQLVVAQERLHAPPVVVQ